MYYSEEEARSLVLGAGLQLVKKGLIARTWGNISARIAPDECIITPSGRSYASTKPEELVRLRISDLHWEGRIKPSSEKAAHAEAYKLRPDAAFIIHTHQFYATVISTEGRDTELAAAAAYGQPGSPELAQKLRASIAANGKKNAFLMERHGALCLGRSCEEAFALAEALETECRGIFEAAVPVPEAFYVSACAALQKPVCACLDDFAQLIGAEAELSAGAGALCGGEDAEAKWLLLQKNCAAWLYAQKKGIAPMQREDALQQRQDYLSGYAKLIDTNR